MVSSRHVRQITMWALVVLVLAACGEGADSASRPSSSVVAGAATDPATSSSVPRDSIEALLCGEFPRPEAPTDWYRPTPIYVGNEMPSEEVRGFASVLDGYENIWLDRDHNGWITVGFVGVDVAAYQSLLSAEFPGVGVVAVEMPYTRGQLEEIRQRVQRALPDDMDASNTYETRGVVEVFVGDLTPERVEQVADIVGDEPVCVSGWDPELRPAPGPQPIGGEGWRYLAEFDQTWLEGNLLLATNAADLSDLWTRIEASGSPPDVDFLNEIVVAFEVGHSGSCPETRLETIDVSDDMVYATIVHTSRERMCTDDYIPRTYVVAIMRDFLPPPPFQLAADIEDLDRITVSADLRVPGSVAAPADTEMIAVDPPRVATSTPLWISLGRPWHLTLDVSCGIGSLGEINAVLWVTTDGSTDLPAAWAPLAIDGLLDLEILLREGPTPTLTATIADLSVEYSPTPNPPPPCR